MKAGAIGKAARCETARRECPNGCGHNASFGMCGRCRAVAEFADRAVAPYAALLQAATDLVAYRNRVGPLGWQLEKADDFIAKIALALEQCA